MSGDANVNLELLDVTRVTLDKVSGHDEQALVPVSIGYLQQIEGELTRLADELTQLQNDFGALDQDYADTCGELSYAREQWGGFDSD